jgi:DNA-binding PadR family transcriptional regulator
MSFRLRRVDTQLLMDIAEYRMMTIEQVAVLMARTKQSIWRRLRDLEKQGFLQTQLRERGRKRGRPEGMVILSPQGWELLKKSTPSMVVNDDVLAGNLSCQDHQLLLNWFRLHLNAVSDTLPQLNVHFLAHSSPLLPNSLTEQIIVNDQTIRFIPDAVFSLTDTRQQKSLLFCLEVDCGTETLASPRRKPTDIRQKILNYQTYLQKEQYKRYEKLWGKLFHGFRLLFLTVSQGRLAKLCQLVQDIPPSDFIWLTDHDSMFSEGLSAPIWARGGNLHATRHSILGRLACKSSLSMD